jgi:hypothetical protein
MEIISRKKPSYPVSKGFRKFLKRYGREVSIPVSYDFLRHFQHSRPIFDKDGNDTLWETVMYNPTIQDEINRHLKLFILCSKPVGTQAQKNIFT